MGGILSKPVLLCHSLLEPFIFFIEGECWLSHTFGSPPSVLLEVILPSFSHRLKVSVDTPNRYAASDLLNLGIF